jgi:hypothetical protein
MADSVELTNLSLGLFGLQNAAFCSGVSFWARLSLRIPALTATMIMTARALITNSVGTDRFTILVNFVIRMVNKGYF